MRLTASFVPLLALLAGVAPAAAAASPAAPAVVAAPAAGPVTVARYSFDGGSLADRSGHGPALAVRSVSGGRVTLTGGHAAFPALCTTAKPCPRALLEGPDDPDLDPQSRPFRWGAKVRVTKAQLGAGSANVVQKGVADTDSQWKLQIGARQGKAHCVVVGQGGTRAVIHLVRSSAGVADGAWHDILCVRAGTRLTVFVDGHDRGHGTIPAGLSVANALPLRIGGPNLGGDLYHGELDDVIARVG
ncbi:LamG-like jellyroll fold domain-containing protein [Symbioplanes lichenis]|uniref:LamG-like jellyroll fold domain-containing protein n=1 Tax=Symbioplanes lichenis TaxID=1629072 RepID=UPI002738EFF2|nr:LamG-like jellyroll fold domain-containing protein [Actinoplanes lichenis]